MSKIKIDKVVSVLPNPLVPNTIYAVRSGGGFDLFFTDLTGATAHKINPNKDLPPIQIGGQFFLDTGEYNGWAILGTVDDTNNQDLGNVGAANLNRVAGGIIYPYDIKIKGMKLWHQNNNGNAIPWGWALAKLTKTENSNTQVTEWLYDEAFDRTADGVPNGNGLRNYGNNRNQLTDLTFDFTLEAGKVLCLMAGAPTPDPAADTNRYSRVMSGYVDIERL